MNQPIILIPLVLLSVALIVGAIQYVFHRIAVSTQHFIEGSKHRRKRVPTECDYSYAKFLGNGANFTGRYDFAVSVCLRCQNIEEYSGTCPNCHSKKFKVIVTDDALIAVKCSECTYSSPLGGSCNRCGAFFIPACFNFYRGELKPLPVPVEVSRLRGREQPQQAAVEELEMPTKIPRPRRKPSTRD